MQSDQEPVNFLKAKMHIDADKYLDRKIMQHQAGKKELDDDTFPSDLPVPDLFFCVKTGMQLLEVRWYTSILSL